MKKCIKQSSDGGNNWICRLSDDVWDLVSVEDICKTPDAKFVNLHQMVEFYKEKLKEPTENWLKSLTEGQDPDLWITNFICGEANRLKNPKNKKFCKNLHQRRRSAEEIMAARNILEKGDFDKCHSFREILDQTIDLTKDVKGFGTLCYYDFSLRYAFHRNIFPEEVYVHASVVQGLKSLQYIKPGIEKVKDRKFGWIIKNLKTLPNEVAELGPLHIENFLCIFHDHLLRYENHLRGQGGDEGPNYGPYKNDDKEEGNKVLKRIRMRQELKEIYEAAKKQS